MSDNQQEKFNYLGSNLRYLQDVSMKNQEQFADIFGIKGNTMSNFMNEKRTPGVEFLIKVSKKFILTLDQILFEDFQETRPKHNTAFVPVHLSDKLHFQSVHKKPDDSGNDSQLPDDFKINLLKGMAFDDDVRERLKLMMETTFNTLLTEKLADIMLDEKFEKFFKKNVKKS